MNYTARRYFALALVLVMLAFGCLTIAHGIQTDHGNVDISMGILETPAGELTYKLYVPDSATPDSPAPGVLLLHGYQNDSETCAAYAIELARRGAVVLSLDEYGHGGSEAGLINRGYVNHRVKVIFGEDSIEEGTFAEIGGTNRYKLMMNFSNLSFFDDRYTSDNAGNTITDSSCGGIAAWAVLADMPNVDSSRMALSGHSMGTWSSWSVAAAYSGTDIAPKATVLQCGELFRKSAYDSENIHFNNVLLLQAKYDEFSYFRDYKSFVNEEVLHSEVRAEFLGCTIEEAAWDTTFGNFEDGSARRMELLETNHRLTTHDSAGLETALDWIGAAISLNFIPVDDQVAMTKEWLVFAAMLFSIGAMLPFMEYLLCTSFFAPVAVSLPEKATILSKKKWWKGAAITLFLAGGTYPFMTQLGHALLPLPEGIFRMTIGNGFLGWYLLLIAIMLFTNWLSARKAKKENRTLSYHEMGLSSPEKADRIDWALCGRSALMTLLMVGLMYLVTMMAKNLFLLDLRFIWPFFKPFTLARFGQFLVYIPFFGLFFLLNNSKIFASMRTEGTYETGAKGFLSCWWRNALLMIGGVMVIVLIEYIPFFAGIGPGADLLFGSTFGGPFMSLLIVFVPQVLVFSLLGTYIYRRTGNVYTGAFTISTLACWIVTGGSAML